MSDFPTNESIKEEFASFAEGQINCYLKFDPFSATSWSNFFSKSETAPLRWAWSNARQSFSSSKFSNGSKFSRKVPLQVQYL